MHKDLLPFVIGCAAILVFELCCILANGARRRKSQDAVARASWRPTKLKDVDVDQQALLRSDRWL